LVYIASLWVRVCCVPCVFPYNQAGSRGNLNAMDGTQIATQSQAKCGRLGVQVVAGIILCRDCSGGYASQRSAREHLEGEHGVDTNVAKSQARSAFMSIGCSGPAEHPMRELYRTAPDMIKTRIPSGKLPPLEGLSVADGHECPQFVFCAKSVKTLKTHFKTHECGELDVGRLLARGSIKIQTLFGGSAKKWFPVTGAGIECPGEEGVGLEEDPIVEYANSSEGEAGTKEDGPDGNVEEEVELRQDGISMAVHELFVHGTIPNGKGAVDEGEVERRLLNDFIDRMEFDAILKEENMSLADAVSAVERPNSDNDRNIGKDVAEYLLTIGRKKRAVAPYLIRKVSLTTGAEFQVVSRGVSERYGREVTKMVLAACRLAGSGHAGEKLREVLQTYRNAVSEGGGSRLKLLHDVLVELLICRLQSYEKPSGLFVRLFIACSSVSSVVWRGSTSVNYRYKDAGEVSPVLAALMYMCSSTAVYELCSVADDCTKDGSDTTLLDERVQRVLGAMDVESNTASSYVRFVMNVCMAQMRMKTVGMKFVECKQHRCCGFVDGAEISLEVVGGIVRKWHTEVEDVLNDNLLFGAELPSGFQSELAALDDILTEKGNGFTFMLHPKRKGWVQKMVAWMLSVLAKSPLTQAVEVGGKCEEGEDTVDICGTEMSRAGVRKWLQACQQIQEALLACVHLASGSPARATEISTYSLRNTAWNVRSIFVSQGEVVIVARYSKKRKLTGGDRPIARFPDSETTRLLLTYLVLIRPMYMPRFKT